MSGKGPAVMPSYELAGYLSSSDAHDDVMQRLLDSNVILKERWEQTARKRALADALVALRQSANLSQAAVAQAAGMDAAQVSRLEGAGGPYPDAKTIARYAEACGASAQVVFNVPIGPKRRRVKTIKVDLNKGDAPAPAVRVRAGRSQGR